MDPLEVKEQPVPSLLQSLLERPMALDRPE